MGQQIKDKIIETKQTSAWSSTTQVYDFFSVFLSRNIITADQLNLSFTPIDYFEQIFACQDTEEGIGYLNLLMMLFTEHFQKNATGTAKISLPEKKYTLMTKQFILYCKCEILRRNKSIKALNEENLFNPNLKTTFFVHTPQLLTRLIPNIKEYNINLVFREI